MSARSSSADFTLYLLENGYYGSNIQGQDWRNILLKYFQSKGMFDDVNTNNEDEVDEFFEQIDGFTAATLYNAVYDVEEYGCEQAMIDQFGSWRAGRQGFINGGGNDLVGTILDAVNIDRNNLPSYITTEEGNLTTGAAVGISAVAIAAVALVSFGAYQAGRRFISSDKKAPLMSDDTTTTMSDAYQKDGLTIPTLQEAKEARKLARFRTIV